MNTDRNSNLYTTEEQDPQIDSGKHSPNSDFDQLFNNLNGPQRLIVQKWMGPRQSVEFGDKPLLAKLVIKQNILISI